MPLFHLGGVGVVGPGILQSIDIRGCTLNSKADLLGMGQFEQVVDTETDTTVYAFNKLLTLLITWGPPSAWATDSLICAGVKLR